MLAIRRSLGSMNSEKEFLLQTEPVTKSTRCVSRLNEFLGHSHEIMA